MKKLLLLTAIMIISSAYFLSSYASEDKKVLLIDSKAPCIAPECHAAMGKKKFVHSIGVDPKHCSRCHETIKEGEHKFKEVPAAARSLCMECHAENSKLPPDVKGNPAKVILEGKDLVLHAPFSEGKCTTCHDAHESEFYRHLKVAYPDEPYVTYAPGIYGLCITTQCHQSFEKALTEARTLSDTKFRNGNINLHFKHVNKKKGRTCRTCHEHHSSKSRKLIAGTFKFGTRMLTTEYEETGTGGSCKTACHRTAEYDRYEPVYNVIKSTPTPGSDATIDELKISREKDLQEEQKKNKTENQEKNLQQEKEKQDPKKQ